MSTTTVYEVGLNELHRVSTDKQAHDQIDTEYREARGREGARLHVTLRAISEADRRQQVNSEATWNAIAKLTSELNDRASALANLIQNFQSNADGRFNGIADQATGLKNQVATFQQAISVQVQETRSAVSAQADAHFQAVSSQARENTERLAVDLRHVRDEVVGLLDSRMTQADASFAALRGDVEVVKFLVMDLIKDRIGRSDPKQKPF